MGVIALMLAGVLVACGTPALKGGVAEEGHTTEGVATKAAETGHETTPATKAAEGGHETAPATKAAVAAETTVKGQVTYLERIALPADAVVTVQLQDVTKADAPAVVVAEQAIKPEGKAPPYAFSIPYDANKINAKGVYAVSVKIEYGGKLQYINTSRVPVITNGAPVDAGTIVLSKAS
jgi:putative lipoprotein